MSQYRLNSSGNRVQGTHATLLGLVPPRTRVLDIGCSSGYLGEELLRRNCRMWGIDVDDDALVSASRTYEDTAVIDLETAESLPWPEESFDVVIAADVLEHTRSPNRILGMLGRYVRRTGRVIVSVPNVAHVSVRLNLLRGHFDYVKAGILDETHLHFFTFRTAQALVEDAGLHIERVLSGSDRFGNFLNSRPWCERLRTLLAYNIIIVARPVESHG